MTTNVPSFFSEIVTTGSINWTIVISVIAVCISALAAAVKIFGKKRKPDELPGLSVYCNQKEEKIKKLEDTAEEQWEINTQLQNTLNEEQRRNVRLQADLEHATENIQELKDSFRTLANKFDDLIRDIRNLIGQP